MKILIVEDGDADTHLLKSGFSRIQNLTTQVLGAGSITSGWKQCQSNDLDLCVIDYHLPDGKGFGLVERMRQAGMTTPAVIISGSDDPSLPQKALDHGATAFVSKSERNVFQWASAILYAAGLGV